jgi:hypothetical protein
MNVKFILVLIFFFGMFFSYAQKNKETISIAPKEIFVSELMSKMTLE